MKAPVGLSSRRPVCAANAVRSAQQGHSDFDALEAAGCGSLRLLRALGGTRILQAAAPTTPPCFGRWPRSSPLQTRGCSPLVTPKQKGSIQKIQVAPLEDFLCCADFESLRDGGTPTAADAASRYDLSRENAMPGGPQTARHCSIINNSSADDTQSKAARILNRHAVVRLPAVPCPQTSAPQ